MKSNNFSLGLLVPPEANDHAFREGIAMILLTEGALKARLAFYMAANAVQSGKEVSMLFSLRGLKSIQKPEPTGGSGVSGYADTVRQGFLNTISPPYLSYELFEQRAFLRMMKQKGLNPLPQIHKLVAEVGLEKLPNLHDVYNMAVDARVKMLPCETSMNLYRVPPSRLKRNVSPPTCAAAFLREAVCSKVIFLI